MTIREAFGINSEKVVFTAIAPKWIYKLPINWYALLMLFVGFILLQLSVRIRRIGQAHSTLREFISSQVTERRSRIREQYENAEKGGRSDIFSLLVKANEMEEKERLRLSDDELVSYISLNSMSEKYFSLGRSAMSLLCCSLVMILHRLFSQLLLACSQFMTISRRRHSSILYP
jgi:hypothetical protein